MPDTTQIDHQIHSLQCQLHQRNHRALVVIFGHLDFVETIVEKYSDSSLRIGFEDQALHRNQIRQYLGREYQSIIYSLHHGFDPELLGAISGTLMGGGILFLAIPPQQQFLISNDSQQERITVYPYQVKDLSRHYLQRLLRLIDNDTGVMKIEALQSPLPFTLPDSAIHTSAETITQDDVIQQIIQNYETNSTTPMVIRADRGRGKSAALGIAAGMLLQQYPIRICVTAPRLETLSILFKHAATLLPEALVEIDHIKTDHGSIQFLPPDQMAHTNVHSDLVLIDEAAAIPSSLLSAILHRHHRCVFATTIHGYEGSGQGFRLRFSQILDREFPNWQLLQLTRPIRWADGDPLEQTINRLLLLNSETPKIKTNDLNMEQLSISIVDRKSLATNEPLLSAIYGIMVDAHYRTTPLDLWHLLDGPNLMIYQVTQGECVVAAAIVANEGALEPDLDQAIVLGHRRPRGHLLPQTLSSQMSILGASTARYRRIIRIAVTPELQQQGIGTQLVQQIIADAKSDPIDIVGTSFGATIPLVNFWSNSALMPVRIGCKRNASSGTHSLVMLLPISDPGKAIAEQAARFFGQQFPAQQTEFLNEVSPQLLGILRSSISEDYDREYESDLRLVGLFVSGHQQYENIIGSLKRIGKRIIELEKPPDPVQKQLLILKILEGKHWDQVSHHLKLTGRRNIIEILKTIYKDHGI